MMRAPPGLKIRFKTRRIAFSGLRSMGVCSKAVLRIFYEPWLCPSTALMGSQKLRRKGTHTHARTQTNLHKNTTHHTQQHSITTPHHHTPRHTTPYHTTPHHTTPHLTTPRHSASHHSTPKRSLMSNRMHSKAKIPCQNMFSNLGQKMTHYFGTPLCRKLLT